jgi:hypothetical protein
MTRAVVIASHCEILQSTASVRSRTVGSDHRVRYSRRTSIESARLSGSGSPNSPACCPMSAGPFRNWDYAARRKARGETLPLDDALVTALRSLKARQALDVYGTSQGGRR